MGEFVGYPAAGGAFTSGGTISNLTALAAARERALPGVAPRRPGGPPGGGVLLRRGALLGRSARPRCSASARTGVRSIPIDDRRRMLAGRRPPRPSTPTGRRASTPVAVVATAGTTLTGAVDPIDELADVCAERGVWLHVDGAYGLPAAARTRPRRQLFAGLDRADSVSLDAHKWLYLPEGLRRRARARPRRLRGARSRTTRPTCRTSATSHHAVDLTLEYSRPFRALKLWLAFRAHGADGVPRGDRAATSSRRGCWLDEVRRHADLELVCGEPQLSIVPFRHVPAGCDADLDAHNAALVRGAAATAASTSRRPRSTAASACVRASSTTAPPTTTCARFVDVTCEVGRSLLAGRGPAAGI